jgi:type I restriction enzyme S subunit
MSFKSGFFGDYFTLEKGISYKGDELVDESDVGLVTLDTFLAGGGYKKSSEKPYAGTYKDAFVLAPGDVVIATTDVTQDGAVLAAPALIPQYEENFSELVWSLDVAKLVPKTGDVLVEFVYNFLRVPLNRRRAAYGDTGTTVRRVPFEAMYEQVIPVPSLEEQDRINSFIATLDRKIQLNTAMAETLEKIAQSVFRSWFIDFDPVKAKMAGEKPVGMDAATAALFPDSMEDSVLGLIPKGWKCGTLEDAMLIFDSKRIPLSSAERKKRPGNFPYYGATGPLDFIDSYLFEGPHVLVGEDGSVITKTGSPYVQYVWGKFWVSNHAHVLQGSGGFSVEQLKLFLDRVQIANYVTGAVQPKLSQGSLKSLPCLLPEVRVSDCFNSVIGPMFEEMRLLSEQKDLLVEARGMILPRLVSGELQVPEELLVQ